MSCKFPGCLNLTRVPSARRCEEHSAKCIVKGCDRYRYGARACSMHEARIKKTGSYGGVESTRRAKGTGTKWMLTRDGYLQRQYPVGNTRVRVTQHREVMSEHIGRALLPSETVHHVNGARTDNRISNLELWSSSQPAGQRVEDKLAWAREIVELYG